MSIPIHINFITTAIFQGAGSALMGRCTKFEQIVRGMKHVSNS